MKYFIHASLFTMLLFVPTVLQAQLFEDFEEGSKNGYAPATITLGTGEWLFNDALIGTLEGDKKNGTRSARIRDGFIEMEFDHPEGMSELSFYAANFGNDSGGVVRVSYSTNSGGSWTQIGDDYQVGPQLQQFTIAENIPGNIRLRFEKTAGNRINVEDVLISDFVDSSEEPTISVRINDVPFGNGDAFNFGTTTGNATASLRLRNNGLEDLEVSSATIEGAAFSVDGNLEVTLGHLETHTVTIVYSAEESGMYEGSITLQTNDPENETFVLNLEGETLDISQPIPIAEARNLPQGTVVTVTGWITAADQFRGPVYFQDETAGIGWYDNDIMREEWLLDAVIGDSLVVTGEIGSFNQLIQIVNYSNYEVFPESNMFVDPEPITIAELNTGDYEGLLVQVTDLTFNSSGIFSGGTNYEVTDGTATGQFRVDNFTNIPGTSIPNSTTEVTAIAGRFMNSRQLLPRFTQDIVVLGGPVITTAPPYEVSASSNSITFEWQTQTAGHSEVRFGTTEDLELGSVLDGEHKTDHSITLTGLDAASHYKIQLRSAAGPDTSATSVYISSTGSPAGSTGQILTFFNKSVAHELAVFNEAAQNVDFAERLIEMIDMAEETAEFAFYSISGSVGNAVANAIINAHNRGVDVRVVQSGHTGNPNAVVAFMANNGVRAVQSTGNEQMHNKFAVIDAHHSDPSKSWVVTSSWNATDQGTNQQFQNMVNIQDVALTRAYWREFNQMWGAESGNFVPSQARFSSNKEVVNASSFWVGEDETYVQLYFSPQGSTESQINRTLSSADESIDLGLNLITRRPISNTMLSRFNEGVSVRGVIGQISGQGSEWDYLSGWADVHHFPQGEFGLLHHKYAIVDGEQAGENAQVITGSHNWSANANFNNDENTLIIRSPRVANEFFQEFGARYWQAGGEDTFNVPVSIDDPDTELPRVARLGQNYPNPFNPTTNIQFELPAEQDVTLQVYDITGRLVATLINGQRMQAGTHTASFDGSRLASGIYMYRMQLSGGQAFTRKMTLIK